jgi:serine/threonine-protein kinase
VNGTWAGKVASTGTTLAIAITNGTAVAYLCDGGKIEAWMRGDAIGGLLSLKAVKGSGRLTGTLDGNRARGRVTEASQERGFDITAVAKPSGLYRATANLRGAAVVGGWIVLPGGRQVGLATVGGTPVRPSTLDLATGTATVSGMAVRPQRQGGDG